MECPAYQTFNGDDCTCRVHIITSDGVTVFEGDRVFDYYVGRWGVVGKIGVDGWFDHHRDDGSNGFLNGERVAVEVPETNPFYEKWLEGK